MVYFLMVFSLIVSGLMVLRLMVTPCAISWTRVRQPTLRPFIEKPPSLTIWGWFLCFTQWATQNKDTNSPARDMANLWNIIGDFNARAVQEIQCIILIVMFSDGSAEFLDSQENHQRKYDQKNANTIRSDWYDQNLHLLSETIPSGSRNTIRHGNTIRKVPSERALYYQTLINHQKKFPVTIRMLQNDQKISDTIRTFLMGFTPVITSVRPEKNVRKN